MAGDFKTLGNFMLLFFSKGCHTSKTDINYRIWFIGVEPFQALMFINGGFFSSLCFIFFSFLIAQQKWAYMLCFSSENRNILVGIIRFQLVEAVNKNSIASGL
ncbi:unnamed protein product [Fraxinus pennsylvanica]|uniref:Uncharacterized protein n=1 Tax=Fraxinus pennsylvanica TaxID=56036 RepID=A0AAD2E3L4_9LAMI|nr:unnamed protein product [Fraxinus pennsylvanica]